MTTTTTKLRMRISYDGVVGRAFEHLPNDHQSRFGLHELRRCLLLLRKALEEGDIDEAKDFFDLWVFNDEANEPAYNPALVRAECENAPEGLLDKDDAKRLASLLRRWFRDWSTMPVHRREYLALDLGELATRLLGGVPAGRFRTESRMGRDIALLAQPDPVGVPEHQREDIERRVHGYLSELDHYGEHGEWPSEDR